MLQSALLTFKHSIIIYLVTFHQPSQRQEIFRKILFYLDKYLERFPQFIKEEQLTAIGGQLKITKNKLFGTKAAGEQLCSTALLSAQLVRVPKYLFKISAIFSGSTSPSNAV